MGFMEKLRQGMPAFIIIMVLAFIALIIFEWGDARSGRGGSLRSSTHSVGDVNGIPIDYVEYQTLVDTAISQQRAMNPDADVDQDRVRDGIWNQLVDQRLIESAAEKMGIFISDQQLDESLLYNPPMGLKQTFTDSTGTFLQDMYFQFWHDPKAFLSARGFQEPRLTQTLMEFQRIKDELRQQLLQEAVQSVVTASAIPSPVEARLAFDNERMKASGSFAMLSIQTIPDDKVTVTDAEAQKYYDEHRSDFQQQASRELRYVTFQLAPSKQDSLTMQKRLNQVVEALARAATPEAKDSVFEGFIEQYHAGKFDGTSFLPFQQLSPEIQASLQGATEGSVIGPIATSDGTILLNVVAIKDSGETFVRAKHILLKTENVTNEDSVKALAEEVAKRAKSGENFESLVSKYSADYGSAAQGGDVGYFSKGRMVPEFEKAAFETPVGGIVGPVKSRFGYHIIKVTDKNSRSYKLRDMNFEPRITSPTKNNLRRHAQQFAEKLSNGQTLDSAFAASEGVRLMESGPIQRAQPVAGTMRLTSFAYQGSIGDVSDIITLSDGSLVVGQISKIHQTGVMDFADAKDQIMAKLRTQKKLDMLKDRAAKLRSSLSPGDSLSKLEQIDRDVKTFHFNDISRTSPLPGAGFDYPLTEAVFSNPTGQLSDPIRGDRGYYILLVDSRTKPTDKEFEAGKEQFMKQLLTQRRSTMFRQWLLKEREHADIVDRRQGN